MPKRLRVEIQAQPDDFTCGPTCLHAVYRYYGDDVPLTQVISEVRGLEGGGTLAVLLGSHALERGYRATIYTNNIQVFDPTWFKGDKGTGSSKGGEGDGQAPERPVVDLSDRLGAQRAVKDDPKLRFAIDGYLEFLSGGGQLCWADSIPELIRRYLKRSIPILTGLSATYLYRCPREVGAVPEYDDVGGVPVGHFVVLCGYQWRRVMIADPLFPNPMAPSRQYAHDINRVTCAILLGILTYDANMLIIERARDDGDGESPRPASRR